MMNLHLFEAFQNFKLRSVDALADEVRGQLEMQLLHFPAMALPSLEKPTVFCGIISGNGVGELWMVTGQGFERTAPVVLRQQRSLCKQWKQALNLHRMHIYIDSDRKDAKRWAEKLGFVFEFGPMVGLGYRGGNQDIYLWKGEQ